MISATGQISGALIRPAALDTSRIGVTGSAKPAESAGADFSALLKQLSSGAAETLKAGEAAAIQGVRGQIATQDVVEAVMAAEQTLQAAIGVRDKAVAAYLELSRMQI